MLLDSSENILRCHVWARGSQAETDPNVVSNTLLQAFTFALVDYVTEYKLLPTLYNNQRQSSFEPPASPRAINAVKFADETCKYFINSLFNEIEYFSYLAFAIDRNVQTARTYTVDTAPNVPVVQSRRVS